MSSHLIFKSSPKAFLVENLTPDVYCACWRVRVPPAPARRVRAASRRNRTCGCSVLLRRRVGHRRTRSHCGAGAAPELCAQAPPPPVSSFCLVSSPLTEVSPSLDRSRLWSSPRSKAVRRPPSWAPGPSAHVLETLRAARGRPGGSRTRRVFAGRQYVCPCVSPGGRSQRQGPGRGNRRARTGMLGPAPASGRLAPADSCVSHQVCLSGAPELSGQDRLPGRTQLGSQADRCCGATGRAQASLVRDHVAWAPGAFVAGGAHREARGLDCPAQRRASSCLDPPAGVHRRCHRSELVLLTWRS